MGPPPPTPVNQPVTPDTTAAPECAPATATESPRPAELLRELATARGTLNEPIAYGGYDLQDVECLDTVPAPPPGHSAAAAPDLPPESSSEEEEVHMESRSSQLRRRCVPAWRTQLKTS